MGCTRLGGWAGGLLHIRGCPPHPTSPTPPSQLRTALQQDDGSMPGFMRVFDCVVRKDGRKRGGVRFAGMVMEELKG